MWLLQFCNHLYIFVDDMRNTEWKFRNTFREGELKDHWGPERVKGCGKRKMEHTLQCSQTHVSTLQVTSRWDALKSSVSATRVNPLASCWARVWKEALPSFLFCNSLSMVSHWILREKCKFGRHKLKKTNPWQPWDHNVEQGEVKPLNKKIPVPRMLMVSLTAANFLGPLAGETRAVPWG